MMVQRGSRRGSLLAVWLLLAALLPWLESGASANSLESIHEKIARYLKRPGLRPANWGIEVVDPTDGRILLAVNPDKLFLPASVVKVVTSAAALEKLGPDFRFRTQVYANGTVDAGGTLIGDLILFGKGDPILNDLDGDLFTKSGLEDLAEKIEQLGIRKVVGDLVGDDSYFESTPVGKAWSSTEVGSSHGAPISALTYNDNIYWVHARPTKYQQRVAVSLEPRNAHFRIRNLGLTGSSKSRRTLYARLIPGTRTVVVSGVLPSRYGAYTRHIVADRPAEATVGAFREELEKRGISIVGGLQVIRHGDLPQEWRRHWKLLAEHESPPLVKALEIMNKRSNNLHAEMLLRTLGSELKGSGTDEAGLQVVKSFLEEAGLQTSRVSLSDGSGLSRENLMTPRFQTSLMLFLSTRPYFEHFLNTLAISGTDGTLKHRLFSEPLRGAIHAKTGTLSGASSLAGYMTTRSGRNLVFTIFANNFRASAARVRKTIDEICALFVNLY